MSLSSWGISVSIVTMLRARQQTNHDSVPASASALLSLMRPDPPPWAQPTPSLVGTVAFPPGIKLPDCKSDRSRPSSAKVKSDCSHNSTACNYKILHIQSLERLKTFLMVFKPGVHYRSRKNWPLHPAASYLSLIFSITAICFNIMLTYISRYLKSYCTRGFVIRLL